MAALKGKKLNILGTKYSFYLETRQQNEKLESCDGYHEPYAKEIHVETGFKHDEMNAKHLDIFQQKVIRHEIIHAFLHESGLAENSQFGRNEELVDWIALQLPKMIPVMTEAGGL